MPVYSVRDIKFSYPEAEALDGVSFQVEPGERVAILGANGSGKSTLLRLLGALNFPARGEVQFEGRALTEPLLQEEEFAQNFHRRVGFIFQNPDVQLFCPTVFDEVAFGPLQLGWDKDRILTAVRATLGKLALAHLETRTPHRLSGGEKKRVALASVLVLDPEVLLLDEPTASLDPESQSRMIDFLFECRGTKTVITATHDLHIVEDIADRCLILSRGRLEADDAPAAVLRDEALLRRTHLIHSHRHTHASGLVHSHPHLHHGHHHSAP